MNRRQQNKNNVFAVPWLRAEQYDALRAASVDRAKLLPRTYECWRRAAADTERRMASFGYVVVRVDIDLQELRTWCERQGRILDGASRYAFAQWKAGVAEALSPNRVARSTT